MYEKLSPEEKDIIDRLGRSRNNPPRYLNEVERKDFEMWKKTMIKIEKLKLEYKKPQVTEPQNNNILLLQNIQNKRDTYNIYIDSINVNYDSIFENINEHTNKFNNIEILNTVSKESFFIVDDNIKNYLKNKYILYYDKDNKKVKIYNIYHAKDSGSGGKVSSKLLCVDINNPTDRCEIIPEEKFKPCVFIISNNKLCDTDNNIHKIDSVDTSNSTIQVICKDINVYNNLQTYKINAIMLDDYIENQIINNRIDIETIKKEICNLFSEKIFRMFHHVDFSQTKIIKYSSGPHTTKNMEFSTSNRYKVHLSKHFIYKEYQ